MLERRAASGHHDAATPSRPLARVASERCVRLREGDVGLRVGTSAEAPGLPRGQTACELPRRRIGRGQGPEVRVGPRGSRDLVAGDHDEGTLRWRGVLVARRISGLNPECVLANRLSGQGLWGLQVE